MNERIVTQTIRELVAADCRTLPSMCDTDDEAARRPVPQLIDYILSTHHAYLRTAMPDISRHLWKVAREHGSRRPDLKRVAGCFEQIIGELSRHMAKEELVLFPYLRELAEAGDDGRWTPSPFGTVANPIRMMEREHQIVADAVKLIRELTHDYAVPADGCATYAVAMAELQQFERDLERHVHLENDVLFPEALRIEGRLAGPADTSRC